MSTMYYWTARIREEQPRIPGESFDTWIAHTEAQAREAVERDAKRDAAKQASKQAGSNRRLRKQKERYSR